MKFSIEDLVTFAEEILNDKLHFLCSAKYPNWCLQYEERICELHYLIY